MSKIERTPLADADVLGIGRYVAEQSQSESAALRLLDAIDEKCRTLSLQPLVGEERPELAARLRAFPVGNYFIFYRSIDDGIEIIRVLHGARDIPEVFHKTQQ